MLTLLNESLKPGNLQAVFRAAADEGCETRSEIAASTGISIVTAGKAVEEFLDMGVFVQKLNQRKSVGRQAGRIRINSDYQTVVLDLRKRNFRVVFYDLSLRLVGCSEHEYIADYSYCDNLCAFLHRIKSQMLGSRDKRFIAISAVVSDACDGSADSISTAAGDEHGRLKLREFARAKAGMPVDLVTDAVSSAVRYCAAVCRTDENILYVNADGRVDARLITGGKPLRRCGGCSAVDVADKDLAAYLYDMIRVMCNVAGICGVVIESEEARHIGNLSDELKALFAGQSAVGLKMPTIDINPQVCYPCAGAALTSRNAWLDKMTR